MAESDSYFLTCRRFSHSSGGRSGVKNKDDNCMEKSNNKVGEGRGNNGT